MLLPLPLLLLLLQFDVQVYLRLGPVRLVVPVHISHIQYKALARLVLNMVDTIPCIGEGLRVACGFFSQITLRMPLLLLAQPWWTPYPAVAGGYATVICWCVSLCHLVLVPLRLACSTLCPTAYNCRDTAIDSRLLVCRCRHAEPACPAVL
jgi:hypothetical protein